MTGFYLMGACAILFLWSLGVWTAGCRWGYKQRQEDELRWWNENQAGVDEERVKIWMEGQ